MWLGPVERSNAGNGFGIGSDWLGDIDIGVSETIALEEQR
jgi:hypothetical protein